MEMSQTPRDGYMSTPRGYADAMDAMKEPGALELVARVSQRLCDNGDGEGMAVVDSLLFALQEVDRCIRTGVPIEGQGTRIIGPESYRMACNITSRFEQLGRGER